MTSKILLDTNILVDFMIAGRPGNAAARRIIEIACEGACEGCAFAGSLKDAYYIASKNIGERDSRRYVRLFLTMLNILPLGMSECRIAAYSDEPDFEDGLVRAAAEINKVDFIITRDVKAFQHSTVRSMSAETYLELFDRPNGAV